MAEMAGAAMAAELWLDQSSAVPPETVRPKLAGVSVTMLWALHNRAAEARRHDGVLVDPASLRIHEAIDYDFARHFGDPLGSLAARAAEIDRTLRAWLERHPDGQVVSLGEGLETQAQRVDNGRMRWLSVDLPEAISVRERFLPPTRRFRHIAASALDPGWMDAIDASSGVFVVAQGLLMYLEPASVHRLFTGMAERFPGMEMVFDTIPRWFSQLTLAGLNQTAHYRLPPMPWGINRDEIEPTLRAWHPGITAIEMLSHRIPRGFARLLGDVVTHVPVARHAVPSLVHVTTARTAAARYPMRIAEPATRLALSHPKKRPCLEQTTPHHEQTTPRLEEITTSGIPSMTCSSERSCTDTINSVIDVATQNARRGGDIVVATTQVVAKRVGLGIAAAFDPLNADHQEFSRMVPEKVTAFSASGLGMLQQSREANQHMMRLASEDVMTTVRATMEIAGYSNPMALAKAQGRFARGCFSRAASSLMNMGMLALGLQAAAMAPIHEAVVANAERLGR